MADILLIEDGVLEECTDKSATSVKIPDGVEEIGNYAFSGCTSLESVEIPSSVEEIGEGAFSDCTSLESVEIPSSVTEIGVHAFSGCTSLSSVVIPDGVKKIGDYAFKDCNIGELSHPLLTIENGCAIKDGVVLYFTRQSDSIKFPDGVTEIGEWAFSDCTSLTSVVIPSSVTKIGDSAFSGCTSLTSVVIPSSVTEIGYAFSDCKSLSSVTLGDDFEEVPSEWFDSLDYENVNYEIVCTEGSSTYKAVKRNPELRMHLNSMEIAKEKKIAEMNEASITAVLSSLLEGMADSGFFILPNTKSATVVIVKIGKNIGVFELGEDSSKWFVTLRKVIEALSDSIKSGADIFAVITEQGLPLAEIPEDARLPLPSDSDGSLNFFATGELRAMNYEDVKNIALFGITEIGEYAFYEWPSLESVEIPPSVTKIGEKAFRGCTSLSSVVIPPSVEEIGKEAFKNCNISELSHPLLTIKNGVAIKDNQVLYFTSQSSSITIPNGVTEIGRCAFYECKSLTSVVIPPSVTKIGISAFKGCNIDNFSHPLLTIENGCAIKENVVLYCTSQSDSIKIPDGVTEIDECAFSNHTLLASVEIPPSVTKIGGYAFSCCESLSYVKIPNSVTQIGDFAFTNCSKLLSLEIPDSVIEIGEDAFYGCQSLASVVIPSSVEKIGETAFAGCESLSSVEFGGTVAQWKAVEKGEDWNRGVPTKRVKCSDGKARL